MSVAMVEDQNTEFKRSWQDRHLKVLCGFANTGGGKLYIGIDDDGSIVGVTNIQEQLCTIPNKIRTTLGITATVSRRKRKKIDIIEIKIAACPPVYYNGRVYVRSGNITIALEGTELTAFLFEHSDRGWDASSEASASIEELDNDTITKFKKNAAKREPYVAQVENNEELLGRLGLLVDDKLTKAAILLFAENPQRYYPNAYVQIGRFKTDTKVTGSDEIKGNLFHQVEKSLEILQTKYLMKEIVIEGSPYRRENLEYPESALREAIINAIIHRNYVGGSHTQIRIYNHNMWIWNAGKLPSGLTIEDLKTRHTSQPRNDILANVFHKAGLIESWGRGTIKIITSCTEAGLPSPDFNEDQNGFSVTLYQTIYHEKILAERGLNERQIKAVLFIKEHGNITISECSLLIPEVTDKTLQRDLNDLVKGGFLIAEGEKRGRKYKLA
jgi:ATP-dependent DNA helicase RecG